jgi:Flp pilus assembly protein TadD
VLGAADRLCLTETTRRALGGLVGAGAPPRPFRRQPRRARAECRPSKAPEQARPVRDVTDPALAGALRLADAGKLEEASSVAASVVERDPTNAPAQFVLGTLRLARNEAATAVRALRAAVEADPGFAAAAFQLGRAHDALGEGDEARRAYRFALERLEAGPSPYPWLLEDVDAADLAVACAARLKRA